MACGENLSWCGVCGRTFICGDCIEFTCPTCRAEECEEQRKQEELAKSLPVVPEVKRKLDLSQEDD